MAQRPPGVTYLGVLYVVVAVGLVALTYYAVAVLRVIPRALAAFVAFPEGLLALALALAAVHLAIAYGLWTLRPWARVLVVAFSAAGVAIGLLTLPLGIVAVLLNVGTLWYVNGREVREAFRRRSPYG